MLYHSAAGFSNPIGPEVSGGVDLFSVTAALTVVPAGIEFVSIQTARSRLDLLDLTLDFTQMVSVARC